MRWLVVIALWLLLPVAAVAQDDRSFLTAWLEDNLSGAGREVRITGFEGALSSQARLATLTIADDDGIWLRLEEVTLDWSRASLLRGRLEVSALSAKSIELARIPVTEDTGPSAEASEFALPELPVSVDIAGVEAERVLLGAPVLGREAEFEVEASLSLEGGAGRARFDMSRIDDVRGELQLAASYSNMTQELVLDLTLSEEEDGIAAELLNLPGRPATDLGINGSGPVSDYTADVRLATDGEERLTGEVRLASVPQEGRPASESAQHLQANVSGDISPLFAPRYRPFFGPQVELALSAWRDPDGGVRLPYLALEAQSLTLSGRGALSPEGWPQSFELEGAIRDADGGSVLLPLAGPPTQVQRVDLSVRYDAAEGDGFAGRFAVAQLSRPDADVENLRLTAVGQITRPQGGQVAGVSARLGYQAEGIAATDPALARAVGDRVAGQADLSWQQGEPLEIGSFDLAGSDYGLQGSAVMSGLQEAFGIAGRVQLRAEDISRFAGLAARELGGAATLDIAGQITPLGGAFDLNLTGTTRDLAVGQAEADRLLRGEGQLTAALSRDTDGLELRLLEVATPEISATASGRLSSDDGGLEVSGRLRDVGLFVPGLNGPLTVAGTAAQSGEDWQLAMDAQGPAATRARLEGTVAGDGSRGDLATTGSAALALANPFIAPRSLSGQATFDLALNGPLALNSLSGRVTATGGRLTAPNLRLALTGLEGSVQLTGGRAALDLGGALSTGGRLTVAGPVSISPPNDAALTVTLQNARLIDSMLYEVRLRADVTVDGPLQGGARIAGEVVLDQAEIRVPSASFAEIGTLPGLRHVNEPSAVRATRARAGLIERESGGGADRAYPLNLLIRAPNRIFVRGRGLDAELGGQLWLRGTTLNAQPDGRFDLIRGRLDFLSKRLVLSEGYAQMQGKITPYLRLVASTEAEEVTVNVVVEGPADSPTVSFLSQPELPEDEVLAQLLFGRSVTDISPFQAAQIASAAATLAGRGGGGIFGRLRESFGLDDLDVSTSAGGSTGVRAGKYISDNVYTDIEIDSDGTSEINLNLDVSRPLTVRGGVGSDGDTGIGVFFERDY